MGWMLHQQNSKYRAKHLGARGYTAKLFRIIGVTYGKDRMNELDGVCQTSYTIV